MADMYDAIKVGQTWRRKRDGALPSAWVGLSVHHRHARGWSRRHYAGQQIDLCPDSTARWTEAPSSSRGGRPRKTAEPYPVIPEAERRPLGTADWLPRPTPPGDPA